MHQETIEETAAVSNDAGFTFMLDTIMKLNLGLTQERHRRAIEADQSQTEIARLTALVDSLTRDLNELMTAIEELRGERESTPVIVAVGTPVNGSST